MSQQNHTLVRRWSRSAKRLALTARRVVAWHTQPDFAAPRLEARALPLVVYGARLPLRGHFEAHPAFEAGKRHNVALAAPAFDGIVVGPGQPFSFWRTLGRVTQSGGYRHGMELSGGCIVPSIGGGLCLLARALFQGALACGLRIDERHGHSMYAVAPPAGVPWGIDATIAWPYVDLRFSSPSRWLRLGVRVEKEALLVSVTASAPNDGPVRLEAVDQQEIIEAEGRIWRNRILRHQTMAGGQVMTDVVAVNRTRWLSVEARKRNCYTCGETECRSRVTG